MSKTAYEIESELMGSAVSRTGFGGRPELINFFVDGSGDSIDASMLPKLDAMDISSLRCGKMVPIVSVLDANGGSKSSVCTVEVTVANGEVTEVKFIFPADTNVLTYTVTDGTWAVGSESDPD